MKIFNDDVERKQALTIVAGMALHALIGKPSTTVVDSAVLDAAFEIAEQFIKKVESL